MVDSSSLMLVCGCSHISSLLSSCSWVARGLRLTCSLHAPLLQLGLLLGTCPLVLIFDLLP